MAGGMIFNRQVVEAIIEALEDANVHYGEYAYQGKIHKSDELVNDEYASIQVGLRHTNTTDSISYPNGLLLPIQGNPSVGSVMETNIQIAEGAGLLNKGKLKHIKDEAIWDIPPGEFYASDIRPSDTQLVYDEQLRKERISWVTIAFNPEDTEKLLASARGLLKKIEAAIKRDTLKNKTIEPRDPLDDMGQGRKLM